MKRKILTSILITTVITACNSSDEIKSDGDESLSSTIEIVKNINTSKKYKSKENIPAGYYMVTDGICSVYSPKSYEDANTIFLNSCLEEVITDEDKFEENESNFVEDESSTTKSKTPSVPDIDTSGEDWNIETIDRDEICTTEGTSIVDVGKAFVEECVVNGYTLRDCDAVIPDKFVICSSEVIGNSATTSLITDIGNESIVDRSNTKLDSTKDDPMSPMISGIRVSLPIRGTNLTEPKVEWANSYLVNGRCFIDSSLKNGVGDMQVDIGEHGTKSVMEIEAILKSQPNYQKRRPDSPIYNDIQCGNGPASNDEHEYYDGGCPGRVDLGILGCTNIGPTWKFDVSNRSEVLNLTDLSLNSDTINENSISKYGKWWSRTLSRGNTIWIEGFNDNIAAVIEYIDLFHPEADTKNIVIVAVASTEILESDMYDTIINHSRFIGVDSPMQIKEVIGVNRK